MPRQFPPRVVRRTPQTLTLPTPCDQTAKTASPLNTPLVIVIVVLVLASALEREGRPVAMTLQLLAGAGLIATEVVRRVADVQG
jgi:hypothetical protein